MLLRVTAEAIPLGMENSGIARRNDAAGALEPAIIEAFIRTSAASLGLSPERHVRSGAGCETGTGSSPFRHTPNLECLTS